jgi:hypothetical protein
LNEFPEIFDLQKTFNTRVTGLLKQYEAGLKTWMPPWASRTRFDANADKIR